MAEAHNAVALSFSLTHDGVSVSYDQELLRDMWHAFTRAYKRRVARFKNDFRTGIFPASPRSLVIMMCVVLTAAALGYDATLGIAPWIESHVFYYIFGYGRISLTLALFLTGSVLWFLSIQIVRVTIKALLSYKGWMYENTFSGKMSLATKLWLGALRALSKSGPLLHAYQGALPHLPLPSLDETLKRHLDSIRPQMSDAEFEEITDWWEEFVYLRQRSPIMINSNYYGLDVFEQDKTHKQAARAANIVWSALQFRRIIERQEVSPFAVSYRWKVPFCTFQYERIFNVTRIPGDETDTLQQTPHSKHIAVLHNGCWYRLKVHTGSRLAEPAELQHAIQAILDNNNSPLPGERELAALTAGERTHWARARKDFFSRGVNKTSLHCIEKAAFVLVLDDDDVQYDPPSPGSLAPEDHRQLDKWAALGLHGNGCNRWFDKSFNLIVSRNARVFLNVEHSWGDAAIAAHFIEYLITSDLLLQGYTPNGDCTGLMQHNLEPQRLSWQLDDPALHAAVGQAVSVAQALIEEVELTVLVWREYGKGIMKALGVSPDAYLQMALQLAYYRNQGHFCLTYESSMTRIFREGRTETVRSCTGESCDFVLAMCQETNGDKESVKEERLRLLRTACEKHQLLYRDAMMGKGIDRHMFALYVVKRYLEEESPFLDKIFPPEFLLSTSQTPLQQARLARIGAIDYLANPHFASAGGGFGPVHERGYGVSYIVAGDHMVSFHISSKKSAKTTSSMALRDEIVRALRDMSTLLPADQLAKFQQRAREAASKTHVTAEDHPDKPKAQ